MRFEWMAGWRVSFLDGDRTLPRTLLFQSETKLEETNSIKELFATELYIYDSKELYAQLLAHKAEIESELGGPAELIELLGEKESRIKASIQETSRQRKVEQLLKWLLAEVEKFYKTFPKYLNLAGQ